MNDVDSLEILARKFKLLAVGTRLKILRYLLEKPLCVGALAQRLGITSGAVSQHLNCLRNAGIVEGVRKGYYMHYRIDNRMASVWRREISEFLDKMDIQPKVCEPLQGD